MCVKHEPLSPVPSHERGPPCPGVDRKGSGGSAERADARADALEVAEALVARGPTTLEGGPVLELGADIFTDIPGETDADHQDTGARERGTHAPRAHLPLLHRGGGGDSSPAGPALSPLFPLGRLPPDLHHGRMTTRIYDEDEVRRILEKATEASALPLLEEDAPAAREGSPARPDGAPGTGLTLSELREIGAEAGIDPERITAAARTLDGAGALTRREVGFAGQPTRLVRQIPLASPLEGDRWDRLVAFLRTMYGEEEGGDATGALRRWKREGLTLHQEPDPFGEGWRIRVDVEPTTVVEARDGTGLLALSGLFMLVPGLLTEASPVLAPAGGVLTALGTVALGWVFARSFPGWVRREERRLDELAGAVRRISEADPRPLPPSSGEGREAAEG